MRVETCRIKKILSFVLLCLVLFCLPVMAQEEEEYVSSGPVTKIDLGVSSLNLKAGESYTFQVKYEPENTALRTLEWYVTDESVISVDPMTDTITALADGEARIFAESLDQFAYDVCTVTVGDTVSKDASVMKSGNDLMGLTLEEMGKISAETLIRYLDFVADSAMDETAFETVADRMFDVLAEVKPGTEEAQSRRAHDCGIEEPEALKELNSVTLFGSLASILKYIRGNEDLRDVYEFGPFYVDEPDMEEVSEGSVEKAIVQDLGGHTQDLINLNAARNLGLTGKGRTIAILDSGLNRNNPVFRKKPGGTITEACFSTPLNSKTAPRISVCPNGSTGPGASAPRGRNIHLNKHNHGSHVSGIAAGADGIAPAANIISVQTHSELQWQCKNADERKLYTCGGNNLCCKTFISNNDTGRAYNFLIDLVKKGTKIDAVNMSYGDSTEYKNAQECAQAKPQQKKFMDRLIASGMLPVAASGNEKHNNGISAPACHSGVYAVGGLGSFKTPKLRASSNHSRLVDITAPGTDIWSANNGTGVMKMSGTSMAAPMVTGAVAVVKQMYPGMDSDDVGEFLKTISNKSVNVRSNNKKFNYWKPVLNFSNLLTRINVPYYNWVSGGNRTITIQLDRLGRPASFSAVVKDLNGNKVGVKTEWKSVGNYTHVKISGNLNNNTIYRVELTRTVKIGKNTYTARTTVYGRPVAAPVDAKKITIKSQDRGVLLNCSNLSVQYKIYDKSTGRLVRTVRTSNPKLFLDVKGLTNGKLYSVTAAEFKPIQITKKGVKKTVNFYGPESARVDFMPMSKPSKPKYSIKNKTTQIFTSAVDPAATGIRVRYSLPNKKIWQICCTSTNNFSCSCTKDLPSGTVFDVVKYKTLNKSQYFGPSAIFTK